MAEEHRDAEAGGAHYEFTTMDDVVMCDPATEEILEDFLLQVAHRRFGRLTKRAMEIIEEALEQDDKEFTTQTALALLRLAKGGGFGELGKTRKGSSGSGDGDGDDASGEVGSLDDNVLATARDRFERENQQSRS